MNTSVLLVLEMIWMSLKAFEGEVDNQEEIGKTCKNLIVILGCLRIFCLYGND